MNNEKKSVILHDTKQNLPSSPIEPGKILSTALSNLTPEQQSGLMNKAAHEALELEVKKENMRLNNHVSQMDIQNHIDTFNSMDKEGNLTRHSIESEIKTASGSMRIQSKSGGACFVATVAYGNENDPSVYFLRWFRDNVLINSKYGRHFIHWYYSNGPKLAYFLADKNGLKKLVKIILEGSIIILQKKYK